MQRIAIVGPESSGKTTLCEALSAHYAAPMVEEYARDFLTLKEAPYVEDDLRVIASVQHDIGMLRLKDGWRRHEAVYGFMVPEERPLDQGTGMEPAVRIPEMPVMFYDTDMITIMIWSQEKFGRVHPDIVELVHRTPYDHWLLCRPNIPWVPDPLRENPRDRPRLFKVYQRTLTELQRPFSVIEGSHEARLQKAISIVDPLIERDPVKEREV